MPIICTWNASTDLGQTSGSNPGGPLAYEIEGTLGQRVGQSLHQAIEDEINAVRGSVEVTNSTEVRINGEWLLTLTASTDGLDKPANNLISKHLRRLLRLWPGDRRTLAWMVLKTIMRWARHEWGLTEAQAGAVAQRAWRATSVASSDGD